MSIAGNVDSNLPHEKIHSLLKQKAAEDHRSEQNVQVQQSATGMQWAAQVAARQVVGQQLPADPKIGQNQGKPAQKQYEIKAPSLEDIALISTSVTVREESVNPVLNLQKGLYNFLRQGFNMAALEESYRETFKKSKSHNLLLERFMSNVKFSVLNGLFSVLGVSAEEQERIQKEVREKALAEIDSRLQNEYAYSKAMMEIVG